MAVYTKIPDAELQNFLQHYDLGALVALTGIAEGVENTNYRLETAAGTFILTLFEKRIKPAELPFFMALMEHLAGKGVACPLPIRGRDGASLRPLAGKTAVIVSFLNGTWPRKITNQHCAEVGGALAQMHHAVLDFSLKRPNDLLFSGWKNLIDKCRDASATLDPTLPEILTAEYRWLEQYWPKNLPEGVIHADLFPDNVFFIDGQLSGVIDFYFACTDMLLYDLAICLNAWCFEQDGAFNATKARALTRGYTAIRPLSAAENKALPVLARGAALRFLLTRLEAKLFPAAQSLGKQKDPLDYLAKLRFHQQVTNVAAYGLDV